jgi:hypothetical protein
MADQDHQKQGNVAKDVKGEKKPVPSKNVPYENRQMAPGRDGKVVTR